MVFNFKNKDQKLSQSANYAPGKRHLSKIYWYLLLILILTPFVYLGTRIFIDTFLMSASGRIMFGEVTIRSPENAYIKKVFFRLGESFTKDQLLIELSNPLLTSQLHSLESEIEILKEGKQKFLDDNTELNHLMEAKKLALSYLEDCRKYVNELNALRAKGLSTIVDTEIARYDMNYAFQQDKAIDGNIARLYQNKAIQTEEYFNKNIRLAEARIGEIKTMIDMLNIRAPEAGDMVKLFVEDNEYVKEGQEVAKIVLRRDVYIIAYLDSKFLSGKLKKGQEVRILFPDGIKIKGVVSASPVFAESDPSKSSMIQSDKNKIVVKVTPKEDIPPQYRISGLPVDVLFY